jgi:ATP-dependent helicase/nuclease subunit B
VQARFLLGPAGSGKTFRCLADIRAALLAASDGPPLILLAPKQATFQLERQLLGWGERPRDPVAQEGNGSPGVSPHRLFGYTRLHILSFERLAQFILDRLQIAPPATLSEEGRVMVLRALLLHKQDELQIFRASARLTGFAQQLSLLLREFQRHRLSPSQLSELADRSDNPPPLRAKLHDLALLLRAYRDWLQAHELQDANHGLDVATEALRTPHPALRIAGLWLDGFAEMTPQELDLLTALMPFCEQATLAFCLEGEPQANPSWLSPWSVVAQTFQRCHARLANREACAVSIETLSHKADHGRFADSKSLRHLEANWSAPIPTPALALEPPPRTPAIRLAVCTNPENEAVLAAREIWRHVRMGGRFRDCAIIVRRLEPYHATIARVFRRYEIPLFMDRREAVAHHPLTELTRFALRTVAFGWRHDDWFGALKSGLVSPKADVIDELENDALAHGWEGKLWREPLTVAQENERGARMELLRQQVVPPFIAFAAALARNSFAPNGTEVAAAFRELWRELKVEEILTRWGQAPAGQPAIQSAVLEQMHDWLDNLERAFAAVALPLRDWLPILEAGLANLTVGVVPPALDQVLIGAVDRSRNPELKFAIVLGLNEGIFPAAPAPATLLTDTDRTRLEQEGVYLGPTRYQRLGHERYLGYIACTRSSERLILTRAAQDAKGQPLNPSPFLDHIQRITGATLETFVGPSAWWESEHLCELEAPALRLLNDKCSLTTAQVFGGFATLEPVLAKSRQVQRASAVEPLSPTVVENIFGRELKSSVSGLEDFAACSFKFFAARGLRLQERKEFQFDDRDKGSFQHDALEEFHRRVITSGREWRDLMPAEAGQLVAEIGRELLPKFGEGKFQAGGAARFAGEFLIERLRRLVTALVEWMPQYDFDPTVSEIAFDDDQAGMPAWRIELGDGHALRLRGRIDRVDLCRLDDHTALAVVMDYKSRVRKLDVTKLYHGLELQLLSYLGVLKHLPTTGKLFGDQRLVPTGVFYIPLNGGGGKLSSTRGQVLASRKDDHREAYQHSGRFLADELAHFDRRGESKGDQFKYAKNKGGDFAKRGNEALPAQEFTALQEKIEDHLRDYGRRIFAGEASVAPFRIGTVTACDYCDFRPVCRFDPWTQPYRDLRPPPKKIKDDSPKPGKPKPA